MHAKPRRHADVGQMGVQRHLATRRLVWLHSFADEAGHPTRHPLSPTWPHTQLSTVNFDEAQPGHTRVTVRWATHDANPAEQATFDMSHPSMQTGWMGTFMQLQAFLAKS